MIKDYEGPYNYNKQTVSGWNSSIMGVYYCGYLDNKGVLRTLYVGKSVSEDGIRGRLLDHLREDYWPRVTHFGYRACNTIKETEDLEAREIKRLEPQHNHQGK